MNALKHGLTSNKMFVLENETPEKWARMLETWVKKLNPRDEAEMQIVTEAAFARWRLQRVWTIETALLDVEMDTQAADLAAKFEEIDEGVRQASAFKALADRSVSLELIHRYETRYRRSFERALKTLEALRELDPQPEGEEPEPVPQLVHKKTTPPPPDLPKEFLPNEIDRPVAVAPVHPPFRR
jgi:hypothetical protein